MVVSGAGNVFCHTPISSGSCKATPLELELVVFPLGTRIRNAACSGQHFLAVSETGALFSWGRNNFGQVRMSIMLFISSLISLCSIFKSSVWGIDATLLCL